MDPKQETKSAFPVCSNGGLHEHQVFDSGMTLRDWFAGQIACGDASGSDGPEHCTGWGTGVSNDIIEKRATLYFRIADAIMKARES